MTRGAWRELRAFREACEAYEQMEAQDPCDWHGCYNTKDEALIVALNERDDRYREAQVWGIELRWRIDEHAAEQLTEE
jgi:hypothetical protein